MTPGKKVFAIVNPRAASYRAGQKWRHIQQELSAAGFDVQGYFTERRHHASDLARDAAQRNSDIILSVGGDGTLNEIVNGLMSLGRTADQIPALGIVSVGTGSDFARTLGLTGGDRSQVHYLTRPAVRYCDLGLVRFSIGSQEKLRYFVNVFDVGLGGSVVRIANFVPKNFGGFLTFLLSSLVGLATFKPPDLRIEIDGQHAASGSITIVGCANGRYFGGGMHIAPMARIDDGRFEILYVKDTNLFRFIHRVLIPVYEARHLGYERLYHRSARQIKVTSRRVFTCDVDGEEEKADKVEISIRDRAVRVLTPIGPA
jgi:diacylglycerol kinase (ATP)